MYWSFFLTPEKERVENYVLEKQSQKGLFFGPRYQVIIDQDANVGFVTKKEFDSLTFGDKITGHFTSEYGFFTKMDQFYDGALLIFLIGLLGFVFVIILINMIISIPIIERKIEERESMQLNRKESNWLGVVLLIIFTTLALTYSAFYTVNLFHKLVPIGQTSAEGRVIKSDADINSNQRANDSTYDLTIVFTAHDGEVYQVKKGVTRTTFNKYPYTSTIDLKYRNNNPYDIFIKTSLSEKIGAVLNVSTILYLLCLLILSLLMRHILVERAVEREDKYTDKI